MNKQPCTHECLAVSKVGKVLMCRDCGVVHLHLQNVSMHFDVEQFAAFASMLKVASKIMMAGTHSSPHQRKAFTLMH
ncbi:DUF6686 family protein [Methylomonas sp. AM2-LC]|uniref:DUF6686 family protein n=1 Tax=Methylomonas sp. AM2-LC TaxID=3153301 RepID=UPI00326770D8